MFLLCEVHLFSSCSSISHFVSHLPRPKVPLVEKTLKSVLGGVLPGLVSARAVAAACCGWPGTRTGLFAQLQPHQVTHPALPPRPRLCGKCISEKCARVTGTPPARVEGLALAVNPNLVQQACGDAEPCTRAPQQQPRAGREGAKELLAPVMPHMEAFLGAPGS